MKWIKFRLETRVGAEEILIDQLMELGIEGVEIEDGIPLSEQEKAQMFVDIPLEKEEDGEIAYLNFYMEEGVDVEEWKEKIQSLVEEWRSFLEVGSGKLEISQTEDLDWVNNWKTYFHQFYIDDILITPSWEEVPAENKEGLVISIDPGTAFGTGMHETTQLCIRQLRNYTQPGAKVLDVGCGSGILGMLALKFGASYVTGIDLDPNAKVATGENMEKNHVPFESYQVLIGDLKTEERVQKEMKYRTYDIVVSNILADVLVDLTKVSTGFLKEDGIYITSGIIEGKEDVVASAMEEAGISVLDVVSQGEWKSVIGQKRTKKE